MDNANQNTPSQYQRPPIQPIDLLKPAFPIGKKEFLFGLALMVTGWFLCNSLFYAGLNLGFAIFTCLAIICSGVYLLLSGCKPTVYSILLLSCALVITASFARGDDGFVKFVMLCFLLISVNLGLCLLAGQNRFSPHGLLSVVDLCQTTFVLGLDHLSPCFRGLVCGVRQSGGAGKKGGAVLLGLLIAIPLLAILIPLLISADAAFEALLDKLPDWNLVEIMVSILSGTLFACYLFARGTALRHGVKNTAAPKERKGVNPLTVNTVLCSVALVYAVYLVSQLAYFSGGFSGILPEDYTMAEYARRGFFEMAWLCAINLGIIALAIGLVTGKKEAPLFTKVICLFVAIITLFLVVSASAKMFLYIDAYGLTRLRVLTQVIIFMLGLTTVFVSLWLFIPKLPYMKLVLLSAMVIGAAVAWVDVDTVVARYNVTAYQTGKLKTVDVDYLRSLGNGAIPYVVQLSKDTDPNVANAAQKPFVYHYGEDLYYKEPKLIEDFRSWNYVNRIAEPFINFKKH